MSNSSETSYDAAILACEELRAAMQHATDTLQHEISSAELIIDSLRAGHSMLETSTTYTVGTLREDLTAALTRLEAARVTVRRRMFQVLIAEGLSIGAISRLWGISRQLAQRITQEATARD